MTAIDLLNKIEELLPRLREIAKTGDLDSYYFGDLDEALELLEAVVEAAEE